MDYKKENKVKENEMDKKSICCYRGLRGEGNEVIQDKHVLLLQFEGDLHTTPRPPRMHRGRVRAVASK